jgi:hypothetical protein
MVIMILRCQSVLGTIAPLPFGLSLVRTLPRLGNGRQQRAPPIRFYLLICNGSILFLRLLRSVLTLESLKAFFEVEQPVQGVAAAGRIKSPHRSAILDLQEFNQSLRLGDILADPFRLGSSVNRL